MVTRQDGTTYRTVNIFVTSVLNITTEGMSIPLYSDLTVSKRPGTSHQKEIHFAVVNHLHLLFSFVKLVVTVFTKENYQKFTNKVNYISGEI